MTRKTNLIWVVLIFSMASASASAQGGIPRWTMTLLGPSNDNSTANSIIDCGTSELIAGRESNPEDAATIWIDGAPLTLPEPNPNIVSSDAWDINNSGLAVGYSYDVSTGGTSVTLWTPVARLSVPPLANGTEAYGHAINTQHLYVGTSATTSYFTQHAFVGYFDTVFDIHDLVPWAIQESVAWDINDAAQVVGEVTNTQWNAQAVVWDLLAGTVERLPDLGGGNSTAFGINQAGDIVGGAATPEGESHAFLSVQFPEGRQTFDLGTLPRGLLAAGLDVNENREVVGWAHKTTEWGPIFIGFYWNPALPAILDINDLLTNPNPNFRIEELRGISKSGQIVGYGIDLTNGIRRGVHLQINRQ